MHDAMGVRRETGIQAKLLDDILRTFEDLDRSEISNLFLNFLYVQ